MNNQKIGFVDSGVGGLTVIKAAQKQLPNEQFVFIGDTARMPYGEKTSQEVVDFTFQMANFLVEKEHIKMLVVACNTATARALPQLQAKLNIPVIGVIDAGVNKALTTTKNKKVALIATNGTVESQVYQEKVHAKDANIELVAQGEPDFVQIVENNAYDNVEFLPVVQEHLRAIQTSGVDTLIMGCTHFPLLAPFIQKSVGNVTLIDPGVETVSVVVQTLQDNQLQNEQEINTHVDDQYYTTGDANKFQTIAERWLDQKVHVAHLKIENNRLEK